MVFISRLVLVLLISLQASASELSAHNLSEKYQYKPSELNQWFFTQKPLKGVVLLAHGLNLKPSKMNSLALLLQTEGYDVLRISLSGHRGSTEEIKKITAQDWLKEASDLHAIAQKHAQDKSKPLYLVAYSLGALVYHHQMNTNKKISFEKQVLFAPALGVKGYTHLVKAFNIFGDGFILNSISSPEYLANPGASMASYNALFKIRKELFKAKLKNSNIPTLVFLDKKDELISFESTKDLIIKHNLKNWKIQPVSNSESQLYRKKHHLIIDEKATGSKQWQKIKTALISFLH
jgi:esterase/lipase